MAWKPIAKPALETGAWRVLPNLVDYARARREFTWEAAARALQGLPDGRGLNLAHEAVDRHAGSARADHTALRLIAKSGAAHDTSYAELAALTNRFANALGALGLKKGERVFALCGRRLDLYVAALGTLKAGLVFCPLFSAFGPDPIRQRLALGQGRVLVTTDALYRRKVAGLRAGLPALEHVLLAGEADAGAVGDRRTRGVDTITTSNACPSPCTPARPATNTPHAESRITAAAGGYSTSRRRWASFSNSLRRRSPWGGGGGTSAAGVPGSSASTGEAISQQAR